MSQRGKAKPSSAPVRPASALPSSLAAAVSEKGSRLAAAHRLDKAFPVFLTSVRGIQNGVGRNISPEGMFIETREVCPIGTEVRVTFEAPGVATNLTAVALVRFQAYLNYSGTGGEQEGVRGMGVRFLRFEEDGRPAQPVMQ